MSTSHFAVDRLHDDDAVMIGDDGRAFTVPKTSLPSDLAEGDVLSVPMDVDGNPNWAKAVIDAAETKRRRRQSQEILKQLEDEDRGSDVES